MSIDLDDPGDNWEWAAIIEATTKESVILRNKLKEITLSRERLLELLIDAFDIIEVYAPHAASDDWVKKAEDALWPVSEETISTF